MKARKGRKTLPRTSKVVVENHQAAAILSPRLIAVIVLIAMVVVGMPYLLERTGVISLLRKSQESQSTSAPSDPLSDAKAKLKQLVAKKDTKGAFEFVNTAPEFGERRKKHAILHFVGEQVYRQHGIKSVALCDGEAEDKFPCTHGFQVQAMAEKGFRSIPQLEKACLTSIEKSICAHIIGHTLTALGGYTEANLKDATAKCGQLTIPSFDQACTDGVFMEYFIARFGSDGKSVQPIQFQEQTPYDVCPGLNETLQTPCYHRVTDLWVVNLKKDFPKMVRLCEKLADARNRTSCIQGVGNKIASRWDENQEAKRNYCKALPSQEALLACVNEVVNYNLRMAIEDPKGICNLLSGGQRTDCESKQAFEWNEESKSYNKEYTPANTVF